MSTIAYQIKDIWLGYANADIFDYFTPEFVSDILDIKANQDTLSSLSYGNFCGPNHGYPLGKYTVAYEDMPFVDCLDFLCFLHDHFYGTIGVDVAFVKSVEILNTYELIVPNTGAEKASLAASNYLFVLSCWFYRHLYTVILVVIFIMILIVIFYFLKYVLLKSMSF